MTFTYTPSATPSDTTRVRFHLGDTEQAVAIFSDEEIAMLLAENTTWQSAVIGGIKAILAKIAVLPDTTADWLRVEYGRSADGWQKLLAIKQAEFGVGRFTAVATPTYRLDSLQDSDFEYSLVEEDE